MSTVREQAIEAGARALAQFQPKDNPPYNRVIDQTRHHAAAVLDAVEPIIRADERERWRKPCECPIAFHEAEVRERLRAQVNELFNHAAYNGIGNMRGDHSAGQAYAYKRVLALLDDTQHT